MFNIRNAVYVALMQIGVIVAGVLAAGLVSKIWQASNFAPFGPAALLLNHPMGFMMVPPGWIIFALMVRSRPEVSDDAKRFTFWSGVLLLIALVVWVGYADITPWFSGTWSLASDDSSN